MKVYYIFKIKEEFIKLYNDTPSVLYNILKTIFYLDKQEVEYGYNLFTQLIIPFKKDDFDRKLFIDLHQDIPYSKRKNVHYINNLYLNEVSRLVVCNYYLKLEVEQNFSSFFKILNRENKNLFVFCFKKTDFFFLDDYLLERI